MLIRLASFALMLMLTACNGDNSGGGGGEPVPTSVPTPVASPVTFTPVELTATYTSGDWIELTFEAEVSESIPDTAFVSLTDPDGVITPDAIITQNSSGSYDIRVKTSSTIPAGHYQGNIEMHFCKDQWCDSEFLGSPGGLPYDIEVLRSPLSISFAPSELTAAYISGTTATLTFSAVVDDTYSGTICVSFVDQGGVFTPDFEITINSDDTLTVRATTSSSVPPGRYQGTIEMRLCADLSCSSHLPGSPASLPYNIEVVPSSPVTISFSPASILVRYVIGDSIDVNFMATVTGTLATSTFVKIIDANGVIMSNPRVTINPDGSYGVFAKTSSSALPGSYQGNIEFQLCLDAACAVPYPGSPGLLPYDIEVLSTTNLTPLLEWIGVDDWGTYQRNAFHTGYVPVTLDVNLFSPRWSWTVPDSGVKLSPVVVANGLVYVSSDRYIAISSKLSALSEYDGSVQWQYDFGSMFALNPPAVSGGKVFVATSGHEDTFMWSFPADTGTPIDFKTHFAAQWERYYAPTVDNGVVYTDGGTYGGLYAFNISDGTIKWFSNSTTSVLKQFDQWTPAVDANYVYAYSGDTNGGSNDSGLRILNKVTGSLVTTIPDPSFAMSAYSLYGSPVVGSAGSVITVNGRNTNQGNDLISFNTNTNAINWSMAGNYPSNPALANGILYIANKSPYRLEARDEIDGSLIWSWTPVNERDFYGNVVATDNLVFLSTESRVYSIDRSTHLPAWSYNKPGDLAISANGVLYITTYTSGSSNGGLVAVNLK